MNFRQAVKRFEATVVEYRAYGTTDGETRAIFRVLIRRSLEGKNPPIPTTPVGWGLYSGKDGADSVARSLCAVAWEAVELAKNASAITRFLKDSA